MDVSVSFLSLTHSHTDWISLKTGIYGDDDEFSLAIAPFPSGGRASMLCVHPLLEFWSQEWGVFLLPFLSSQQQNSSTTLGIPITAAHLLSQTLRLVVDKGLLVYRASVLWLTTSGTGDRGHSWLLSYFLFLFLNVSASSCFGGWDRSAFYKVLGTLVCHD